MVHNFVQKWLLKGCDQSHQVKHVFLLGQIIQTSSLSATITDRQTDRSFFYLFQHVKIVTIEKHHNEYISINIYISWTSFSWWEFTRKWQLSAVVGAAITCGRASIPGLIVSGHITQGLAAFPRHYQLNIVHDHFQVIWVLNSTSQTPYKGCPKKWLTATEAQKPPPCNTDIIWLTTPM